MLLRRLMRTIGFAVLSLLAREPLSGYDLASQLRERVGTFFYAGHSHVYPELSRLEKAGLVVHERVEQRDRPTKKLFRITPAGREAVREWVTGPLDPALPFRDELTLRAFSIWLAERTAALAFFGDQERVHRERLTRYEAIRAQIDSHWPTEGRRWDMPDFASYAALERGIRYERELTEWCAWMQAQIGA